MPCHGDGTISGYVFKLARESVNCTQVEMAQQLAMDPQTIHSWETGRRSLAATNVRDLVQLRVNLLSLGVDPALVEGLNPALEADYILSCMLATGSDQFDIDTHPLANWLLPHTVSEMLAWALGGAVPSAIDHALPKVGRRGPVASAPALSIPERKRFFENLSAMADVILKGHNWEDERRGQLGHQLYLRIGWNRDAETSRWLRVAYTRHRARFPRLDRWSPRWLELRSLVIAMAYHGDVEPLHRFVRTSHVSDECEMANLNYWAYWVGELRGRRRSQEFMVSADALRSWTGVTLLRRLIWKLDVMNPYLELNIHSIATLLGRPITFHLLDGDRDLASSLRSRVDGLLSQPMSVSVHARRELEAIRRGVSRLPRTRQTPIARGSSTT
jgi:transcriptional regulator with XRE-family HTH domain